MALPGFLGRLFGQTASNAIGFGVGTALGPVLAPAVTELAAEVNRQAPNQRLSPQEAALLRQRGQIDQARHYAESLDNGVDNERAELMFQGTGLSMGVGEALQLLRRGQIDEARFAEVVREGDTKVKYTDDLLKLIRVHLSPALAAELLIRERIPREKALEIAKIGGLNEEDFLTWSDGLGRPIAVGEAQTVVNRGLKGPPDGAQAQAYFREAVARSDVRTQYADDLFALRRRLPSIFQIKLLLGAGALDDAYATELITQEGYDAKLAAGIVAAGHNQKTAKHRDLAEAQVLELFESGLESEQWAHAQLVGLGFDDNEAVTILLIVEARRLLTFMKAAVNRVHTSYVGHKIDDAQATNELDALQMAPEARNRFLALWNVEREANVRRLTEAQVAKLLKHDLITTADALARFEQMGYPAQDAQWLVVLTVGPTRQPPPA